ncbi:MAG TPA: TauD/TfdA family dioxygenase [Acidimicrobiales bacterium]|nr:TauD/TfdA family dioxygenase [Acidimicrobiales bacterium]
MAAIDTEVVAQKDPGARLFAQRLQNERGLSVGPCTYLAAERERLAGLDWPLFDVVPLSATVGGLIEGVDLTNAVTDELIEEIRRALFEYKVIFFRDQPFTPAEHVAFARRFGELEVHPFIPPNADQPELVRFAKSAEVGGYENSWHHDVTWRAIPSMGAILHAIQVPAVGGDTLFSDMYAAYDALDDDIKDRIAGMTAVHDFMRAFSGQVPAGREQEFRERYPLVEHPVVCRHPDTGRKLLYVNTNFTSHIVGLDEDDSRGLLALLCRQAHTIEHQCRFRWQKDSVAFWDNRAVQHYAASDYWPEVRITERASIVGTRPTA